MSGKARRRLDAELVRRGLLPSRARAADAIESQRVVVSGTIATKASRLVRADEPIHVTAGDEQYVSRGGFKLAAALDAFGIDAHGRRCLDAGVSTGGFTDCLLQRGAEHVVAVDVGHGQLDWRLRNDRRVDVRERTSVRNLASGDVEPPVDLVVADLSFISLGTVAGGLVAAARDDADFVLLVKPQFEADPERVGRGGIVRSPDVHAEVLRDVVASLSRSGIGVTAFATSPITGADGNREFFVRARRGAPVVVDDDVAALVGAAVDTADACGHGS
jgi:23S rRNA (cytidine1920-2'-O)/16S rRNA (cytidine1409-2'-O)-methyltransferase